MMKKLWKILISAVIILGMGMTPAVSETAKTHLTIHLTGFDNDQGKAMVAISNSEENYNSGEKPYAGLILPILNREVHLTMDLPFGDYAVKVFHDANENEQMDTMVFGIPKERYGFSNNARGTMGPPAYDAAKVSLSAPQYSLGIKVK